MSRASSVVITFSRLYFLSHVLFSTPFIAFTLLSATTRFCSFFFTCVHTRFLLFFFCYHLCSIPANLSFAFLRVNPPYYFSIKEKKTLHSVSPHCSQRQVLLFFLSFFHAGLTERLRAKLSWELTQPRRIAFLYPLFSFPLLLLLTPLPIELLALFHFPPFCLDSFIFIPLSICYHFYLRTHTHT